MRVKFYSADDLSCGTNLQSAESILDQFNWETNLKNINDTIELYNIKKYIDCGLHLISWNDEKIKNYETISKTYIPKLIGSYLSGLNDNNIESHLNDLEFQYDNDFWELFANYKIYKRISPKVFRAILDNKKSSLYDILIHKSLVDFYDCELSDKIRNSSKNAKLLVYNYLEIHPDSWEPLFFPESLSEVDKSQLISDYISSESPNPNVIKLISNSQSSPELKLSDEMIYSAKERYENIVKEFFDKNEGVKFPFEIIFDNDIKDFKVECVNNCLSAKYNLSWITENLDFPTILNNFIYLFKFVDSNFRCAFVSDKYDSGIISKLIGLKGKKEYPTEFVFRLYDDFFLALTMQYETVLQKNDVDLLTVYKWFFENYLRDEFNVEGFEFDIPSKQTTYLEKCKLLASGIERTLKQFKMLVNKGMIDHKLLSISSAPTLYKDIPSFINDKYIYATEGKLNNVYNGIFSNQSILRFDIERNITYESVHSFLNKENVKPEEYVRSKYFIEQLISENYLYVNEDGYLKPNNKKLYIIKDLFKNNVLCNSYLGNYSSEINELKESGQISYGKTLFSIPEQKYLNYLFNKAEFSNGLDLRNKYVHGNHEPASEEKKHKQNYYIFIRTIAFIIIKINEEFCLRKADES